VVLIWAPLLIVFFRETQSSFAGASLCGVSSVLKSSRILYTLRFSVRCFLALIAMDGMYAGFAGAKACHKKSKLIEVPNKRLSRHFNYLTLSFIVQAVSYD